MKYELMYLTWRDNSFFTRSVSSADRVYALENKYDSYTRMAPIDSLLIRYATSFTKT